VAKLDPGAEVIVQALSDVYPRLGTEVHDAAEARRLFDAMPRPAVEPIPVGRVEDRAIPGPDQEIPVRVYWPETGGASTAPPVVVFFHGGGWVLAGLHTHDQLCRMITAGAGVITVSVDYRLAPDHRFPAAVEDAYAATCWAADHAAGHAAGHADELGGDPARLAVAGDSAGGNLAAATALMARDRGGPALAFQLLVYPVLDHRQDTPSCRENAEGFFLTADHMRWYWEQYLGDGDGSHPYASPVLADDLTGLPPAHIVTAACDPLRDEGEEYGRLLAEAGVPTEVRRYDGMFHGFFSMRDLLPAAADAQAAAFSALRAALASGVGASPGTP
jgi:acetyl esterase/lipase